MTFKKDYINYLLYTVVNSPGSEFTENYRLRKLVDNIIAIDDVMKITYVVGKTAGLELLFKYLLYISDKIDKSQVTIFNLKDNFEYDKINIIKICSKIEQYKSENVQEAIKSITEESTDTEAGAKKPLDNIKITTEKDNNVTNLTHTSTDSNQNLDAAPIFRAQEHRSTRRYARRRLSPRRSRRVEHGCAARRRGLLSTAAIVGNCKAR